MKNLSPSIIVAASIISAIGVGVAAISLPAFAEQTDSNCHALEKKAVDSLVNLTLREDGIDLTQGYGAISLGILNTVVQNSQGFLASSRALSEAPSVPPELTCSSLWWFASLGGGDSLAREIRGEAATAFEL